MTPIFLIIFAIMVGTGFLVSHIEAKIHIEAKMESRRRRDRLVKRVHNITNYDIHL